MTITDFQPRFTYPCESPEHDARECLTLRTESGERYCYEHFPWNNDHERRHVKRHLQSMGLVVE